MKTENEKIEALLKDERSKQPIMQEATRLDDLARNNQFMDDQFQKQIDKHYGPWQKFWNPKEYEQVRAVKAQMFTTSADYRLKFYRQLLDARLEAFHEKCDSGIKCLRADYRQKVISFLMLKRKELSTDVAEKQTSYIDNMTKRYTGAEKLKADFPERYQRLLNTLFEEEGKYLAWLGAIIEHFESIIEMELKKYA